MGENKTKMNNLKAWKYYKKKKKTLTQVFDELSKKMVKSTKQTREGKR